MAAQCLSTMRLGEGTFCNEMKVDNMQADYTPVAAQCLSTVWLGGGTFCKEDDMKIRRR